MRFSPRLYAQHLGWTFKKHWQIQGKRIPNDTGAASELEKLGIQVKDVEDVIKPKVEKLRFEIIGNHPVILPEDETHPDWHQQKCHMYGNANVLLEGLQQAQVLTKTIEVKGFPKTIEDSITKTQLPSNVDRHVHQLIMASHVLDAEQVKLPKVKLLDRPAFNLPRDYGISHQRKNRLLTNKLITECEKLSGRSVASRRQLLDQVDFKVTIPKGDDLLQFEVSAEKLITSTRPIEQIKVKYDGELPDLYPIKYTISLPKKNIYTTETFYPLSKRINTSNPHTIVTFFNKEFVGNLHDVGVTTTQFQSRTMLKAFAVAAARAKQLYGESALENLPKPIVVQSIQTDGRTFHFGIFQLNTLALGENGDLKNYWFHESNMDLFTECGYKTGRPYLEGYNKDVFRCLNAFYNNS
ncbi:39S ribosomal protein L37, mitochondrial [Lucilia cuprina]|uniref:39S ribosomal protein L37, mitochondrial n=1 Tax=Lucilia cuprina TaxID=7375 RepID=UPI001F05A7DF|nr:39S ribosomal protein L37, mitochondrial [Lucilia cuprina]